MSKESVYKDGSGSRKGFVSKFQTETNFETQSENNVSKLKNKIFNKSAEHMSELIDNCVSLTVTSPPYNVGKLSDLDLDDKKYWKLMESCFQEVYRVTESGGRLVVNVANLGRKPYIPFSDQFTDMLTKLGFIMRG